MREAIVTMPKQSKQTSLLRQERERWGFSQKDVAKAVGVTEGAYSLWELGKVKPHPENIQRLLKFFQKERAEELGLTPSVSEEVPPSQPQSTLTEEPSTNHGPTTANEKPFSEEIPVLEQTETSPALAPAQETPLLEEQRKSSLHITRRRLLIGGISVVTLALVGFAVSHSSGQMTKLKAGAWSTTGSMAIKRVQFSATLLQDGSVLVAGGTFDGQSLADFSEIYRPATGTWSTTKNHPIIPRLTINNNLVTLPTGKALLAGGSNAIQDTDYYQTEIYDPATQTWTRTADLNMPRRAASLIMHSDGYALIIGGSHGPPTGDRFLPTCEMYDPTTEKWTYVGNLTISRERATWVQLHDGRVLIAGGEGPWKYYSNTVEIFNPHTKTWTLLSHPMPWGWIDASMTVLSDNRVFVAGGFNQFTTFSHTALYNPYTQTWTKTRPMNTARSGHIAVLLPRNKVLIAGGGNQAGTLQTSEIYDPANDSWSPGPPLQEARVSSRSITLANNSTLAIGGARSGQILNSCELFLS